MATVGLVAAPQMGRIADEYAHDEIPAAEALALFESAGRAFASSADSDVGAAGQAAVEVLAAYQAAGELPAPETANALRAVIASDGDAAIVGRAQAILGPADNYGGRVSFLYVVPLSGVLMLIFGAIYMKDRASGGYTVERIEASV